MRPPGENVSLERAAQLLGVCRRTIYYWIGSGRLQTIRTIGGSQRVLLESISKIDRRAS
jgi:excisionase family DNA binding protein